MKILFPRLRVSDLRTVFYKTQAPFLQELRMGLEMSLTYHAGNPGFELQHYLSRMCLCTACSFALRRLKQEDKKFKVIFGYT